MQSIRSNTNLCQEKSFGFFFGFYFWYVNACGCEGCV